MRALTHRFAIPVISWIVFVLGKLLRAVEVPFEPAESTLPTHHPCDDPQLPAPLGPGDFDWRVLRHEADRPIEPVRRIKPFTVKVDHCYKCGAPREYLYSYGFDPEGRQKVQCKLCAAQWAPEAERREPDLFCPFCGRALGIYKHRSEFDLFRCPNIQCPGRRVLGTRYKWRLFHWEPRDLETSEPGAPVELSRLRYSARVVSQAVSYVIGVGTSLRQATRAFYETFQFQVSPETLRTWLLALAVHVAPLLDRIPLPFSGTVVIDETYVKVRGRWHYLFAAMDAHGGHILAVHLSKRRNSRAAATIIRQVLNKAGDQSLTLITDAAPIYTVAVAYWQGLQGVKNLTHKVVRGLETLEDDPPGTRRYKNRVERLFGSYKAHYKRHKSFQTFAGAWAQAVLFMLDYNHLKPHEAHHGAPPVPLVSAKGQPVTTWQELLPYLTRL